LTIQVMKLFPQGHGCPQVRVHDSAHVPVALRVQTVIDEDPQIYTDLISGQPDPTARAVPPAADRLLR
jgi:hypothetical protein